MFTDVMYEHDIRLVISCEVELHEVFLGNLPQDEESLPGPNSYANKISVIDEGGTSGRLTTMLDGGVEWSATGRLGVSLAQFSAIEDVRFAFTRAQSRLYEMQGPAYLKRWEARHNRGCT